MRMSGLSFESMPPLFIPLRFFLTAPVFAIVASILFLFNTEFIFISRWSGETLALTHLFTLGFMLMSMTGALFQFIPVITGHAIPASKKMSTPVYLSLVFGCVFLCLGFISKKIIFFQLAVFFISVFMVILVSSLSYLLFTLKSKKETIVLLRLVDFSLFITIGLGLLMILANSFDVITIIYHEYTNIHILWGFIGWTILLILTVSSQVIPMFHVTPKFSPMYLKALSIFIFICLLAISLIYLLEHIDIAMKIAEISLSLGILIYASYSLFIINKRKRKVKDISINFWRLALLLLILVVFIFWFNLLTNSIYTNRLELLLGVIFIFGFAISSIMGMMQKIVPFIIYMHLQRQVISQPDKMSLLPNMQSLISVSNQQIQFYLHTLTIVLLAISIFYNFLTNLAGFVMLMNFIWLSYNLNYSTKKYLQISRTIDT